MATFLVGGVYANCVRPSHCGMIPAVVVEGEERVHAALILSKIDRRCGAVNPGGVVLCSLTEFGFSNGRWRRRSAALEKGRAWL
jgi:hypothetical protein